MKTKKDMVQQVVMTILTAALVSSGITACSDDLDMIEMTVSPMTEELSDAENIGDEQTSDAMAVSVTTDMPAAVLSKFDESSMGAALVRRLPSATGSVSSATRLILVKGDDLSRFTGNDMKRWANTYLNGGNIAVERPTGQQLTEMATAMSEQLSAARTARLTADGDVAVKARGNRAGHNCYEGELLKVRAQNVRNFAVTRSGVADPENDVVADLVIFSANGYYMYATTDETSSLSEEMDQLSPTTHHSLLTTHPTPYKSGLQADGAAEWLTNNAQSSMLNAQSSLTRGSAEAGINDLMSCSDQFTVESFLYTHDWERREVERPRSFSTTYRIWGVNDHGNNANTDYYYVKQSSTLHIGGKAYNSETGNGYYDTFYWGRYKDEAYLTASNWSNGDNLYYGSWLSKYETSIELTGSGNITTEYALPGTDNNTASKTIAIGTSHTESENIGFSFTGMFCASPGINAGVNYSYGWADGTSFTMSTTTVAKELKVVKNTQGNKITWTYENGQKPELYTKNKKVYHTLAPDAVTNDVDVENQACWSVKNPSGRYTINVTNFRQLACLTAKDNKKEKWTNRFYRTAREDSYTLLEPNRAEQVWHFDVTPSTLGQTGHNGDKQKLTDALMTQFPDVFKTLTRVADRTIDSENAIQYIVEYAKSIINDRNGGRTMREYALDLGCDSYTIRWYCMDGTHNDYELTISVAPTN